MKRLLNAIRKQIHSQMIGYEVLQVSFLLVAFSLLITGCVHRQKDRTVDKSENQTKSLKDYQPVCYEMPEVGLLFSKALPDSVCTTEEKYRVWTEQKCYPQNVTAINYFVENRTDTWWTFGRDWTLQIWDGAKWCPPKQKKVLFWFDDGFWEKTSSTALLLPNPDRRIFLSAQREISSQEGFYSE